MRAAPTPARVATRPTRQAAIQPTMSNPTRRMLDRRMGTPSARHAAWLGRYQDWQWDAKRYARTVGVVRFAAQLVAATAGRVNLIVEQRNAAGEWEETKDPELIGLLAAYGNETFGQTANELVRLHTWHYCVAGEAVMMHRDDTNGEAEWMIASMDAIEWDRPQTGYATVKFHPGGVVSDGTAVILPRDQMMRYWMPDEEWLGLATSPMTSVMDDIRRYKSLVRYAQRQAESYLAMNGILWTTEKIHKSPASGDVTGHEGGDPISPADDSDRLFDMYNEWANMSINDDDSLAAVVPPMMWGGDKDDIPQFIDFKSVLDEHGVEHRDEALRDIGRGSDTPMALIVGGGSSDENHWGAWITEERFVGAVAPTLDRVTHQDMTVAFLYPLMRLAGRTDLRRTRIGYDATPVIVHPDKSDKALRAVLVGGIGYSTLREAMGFDESDAPTPEDLELLKQVLSNFGAGQQPGQAPPGQLPSVKKPPGEKVSGATVEERPPPQPTGAGTRVLRPAGKPLGVAASVLDGYVPSTVALLDPDNGNGHHHGDPPDPFADAPEPGALQAAYVEEEHPRGEAGRWTTKEEDVVTAEEPTHPDVGESPAWDRLPADQQQAILAQAEKHRLDYDEMNARADALLDYALSPEGQAQEDKGLGWYQRMRDLADERAAISGVTREEYIGLVAATSPRMQWDWESYPEGDPHKYPNLNAADLMADLWNRNPDLTVAQYVADQALVNPVTGKAAYAPRDLSEFVGETRPLREWDPDIAARILAANHMLGDSETAAHVMWPRASDALEIMHASAAGMDPAETLGGPKTFAFNETLLDPNYQGAVIDAWMIQALSGRAAADTGGVKVPPGEIDVHVLDQPNTTPGPRTTYKEQWEPRGTVYTLMSAAVEEAAADHGLSASDAQAMIWYVLRDTGFSHLPPELQEAPTAPTDRSL